MVKLFAVSAAALALLLTPALASATTADPDGTINCGERKGYSVEVGDKRHCPLGWRVMARVRSYYQANGVRDGDMWWLRARDSKTGRYVTLRCLVAAGRFGSRAACSRDGTSVSVSRYA